MDMYLIVEPDNGRVDLCAAPRMFEIGEIVPSVMPELKGVMPVLYIVEHPDRQVAALHAVASKDAGSGLPPRICALLETEADAETLMIHLGNTIALARESGTFCAFRFYDPRVFRHLHWVLPPEQYSYLYGPISRWRYFYQDDWVVAERPLAVAKQVQPTDEQWATLRRLHLIEKALQSIRDAGEPVDESTAPQLNTLFEKGAGYGLSGEDLAVFAVQSALVSPHLDRHPKIAAALQKVANSSYSEVTAQWSDEEWAKIAHDIRAYG